MGWNDHIDDDFWEPPLKAWGRDGPRAAPFDPDDDWLEEAPPDQQRAAMRAWFLARYCDPAHETPYNGREGGFLFVHGGPYRPSSELQARFSATVSQDFIEALADDLVGEVGEDWAPVSWDTADDFDERFDLDPIQEDQPLDRLHERLAGSRRIMELQGDVGTLALARTLVFSAIIGTLEAFLWETAQHWIDAREEAFVDCVTRLQPLSDETIKIGDILKRHEGLRSHVRGHLQNMVWHRWDQVGRLYRAAFKISLPSTRPLEEALVKRHDIVHRSGHTRDGAPIQIETTDVDALIRIVEAFAVEVADSLASRFAVSPVTTEQGYF